MSRRQKFVWPLGILLLISCGVSVEEKDSFPPAESGRSKAEPFPLEFRSRAEIPDPEYALTFRKKLSDEPFAETVTLTWGEKLAGKRFAIYRRGEDGKRPVRLALIAGRSAEFTFELRREPAAAVRLFAVTEDDSGSRKLGPTLAVPVNRDAEIRAGETLFRQQLLGINRLFLRRGGVLKFEPADESPFGPNHPAILVSDGGTVDTAGYTRIDVYASAIYGSVKIKLPLFEGLPTRGRTKKFRYADVRVQVGEPVNFQIELDKEKSDSVEKNLFCLVLAGKPTPETVNDCAVLDAADMSF